jgi:tRNA nucleotidyltransferase (CCA-adding enzyme)
MTTFYQVGGSLRDEALGLPSKDIDYAVEASSFEEMKEAVLSAGGEIFLEKPEYLTLRARVGDIAADYVLCRKDGAYYDGRRPDSVTPGTIFEDLARRDFTMNAMAKAPDGTILDPHGGMRDARDKVVRCVGSAEERFTEDGLRMLRALRFCITKDMSLEGAIVKSLSLPAFFEPRLSGVSVERVREEFDRMFRFSTYWTMIRLDIYRNFRNHLFGKTYGAEKAPLWLRPTLEGR